MFNNNISYIFLFFSIILLFISIGYSYLNTDLGIQGNILVTANENNNENDYLNYIAIQSVGSDNGTVTAHYLNANIPIEDLDVYLFKLTKDEAINDRYYLKDEYDGKVNLNITTSDKATQESWKANSIAFGPYFRGEAALEDLDYYAVAPTGSDGVAHFTDVEPGLYLLTILPIEDNEIYYDGNLISPESVAALPSIIIIPRYSENGGYEYDANIASKTQIYTVQHNTTLRVSLYFQDEQYDSPVPILASDSEYKVDVFYDKEATVPISDHIVSFHMVGTNSKEASLSNLYYSNYYAYLMLEGNPILPNDINVDSEGNEFFYQIHAFDSTENEINIDDGFYPNEIARIDFDIIYLQLPESF